MFIAISCLLLFFHSCGWGCTAMVFFFNIDVPYIFDIAGVAATGHIIGIDIISSLSKFRK
jgi:hypothetical protein